MTYTIVKNVDDLEFGYFQLEDGTFQCAVFNDKRKLNAILAYAGSPREAEEAIDHFVKNGFNLWGWEFEGIRN